MKVYREAKPSRKKAKTVSQPSPYSTPSPTPEITEMQSVLDAKRQEMKLLAEENAKLIDDIAGLKYELDQVGAMQLYVLRMNLTAT